MTGERSYPVTGEAHLLRIILGLFNPMPDSHEKGCLHNDPHIHPRGPCICSYAETASNYLWALREAKKIAGEHYGQKAVDESRRLKEPNELVEAAGTGGVAQRPMDRDEIAKRIAFAHLGDDREWKGFRSHADRFLAYALPSTDREAGK